MKKIVPFVKEVSLKTMIGEITSISLENTLVIDANEITGDLIVSGTYKMTEASQIEEKFEEVMPVFIDIDEKYDTLSAKCDIDDFYYEIVNDESLKVNIDILIDDLEEKEITDDTLDILEDVRNDKEEVIEELDEDDITSNSSLDEEDIDIEFINNEPLVSLDEEVIKNHLEKKLVRDFDDDFTSEMIPVEINESIVPLEIPVKKQEKVIVANKNDNSDDNNKISSIFEAFKDTDETFATYRIYIIRENDTLDNIMEKYNTTREELIDYNNLDEIKIGMKLIIPSKKTNEG